MVTLLLDRTNRKFEVYAIPTDGPEPTTAEQTVPVLVGMTHFGPNRAIVDHATGDCVYAALPDAKPHRMPQNKKGHFMVDIVGFLRNDFGEAQETCKTSVAPENRSSEANSFMGLQFENNYTTDHSCAATNNHDAFTQTTTTSMIVPTTTTPTHPWFHLLLKSAREQQGGAVSCCETNVRPQDRVRSDRVGQDCETVSYTHLTLPTKA